MKLDKTCTESIWVGDLAIGPNLSAFDKIAQAVVDPSMSLRAGKLGALPAHLHKFTQVKIGRRALGTISTAAHRL